MLSTEGTGLGIVMVDGHVPVEHAGGQPDFGSGPYLELIGAAIRLAHRDLEDPKHSEEARAFLRGEPHKGEPVGIDLTLFAECIGYGGGFER